MEDDPVKRQASLSFLAFLVTAGVAPVGAQSLPAYTTASILFSRTNWRAIDSSHDAVLYRVKPAGGTVVPLTPVTYHVDYVGGRWSPGGGSIVYERAPQSGSTPSQLFVVDRQGAAPRQITTGPSTQPSWGPGATIAFVTAANGNVCLGAVRADGTHQRIAFCPPPQSGLRNYAVEMSTPQWTPNGKGVYVDVGAYEADLDPRWVSRVYRVNLVTGTVTKMTEQYFGDLESGGDAQTLAIAPDGKHGVYADYLGGPLQLIDFSTGTLKTLPIIGSSPVYSKDGSQIAFNQRMTTDPRYNRVFVMNADGSNPHAVIASPDPEAEYSVADWSPDDTRLLVNKVGNDRLLQIVTLATGATTTVTKGTADKGAWFHF